MKSEQVIQRLSTTPEASIENLQEHRYWLQCERAYTYQPIYRTDGRLMAIEVLTVVTHPSNPSQRIAPDRYFAEVAVRQRIDVLEEQLRMLATKQAFFEQHGILASVNVDGPTLMALRQNATLQALIATLPWMRLSWWNMFSCHRTPRLPRCVSLARCGWMISVPVWPTSPP